MKPTPSLLLLVFIFLSCGKSSTAIDLSNEKEVHKVLVATWEAEYIETRAGRNQVPESMISHLLLREDGTYTNGVKNGVIKQTGKWSYNPTTKMLIINTGTVNASSRILSLTETELIDSEYTILSEEIVDSTVMTYKKL